jgi:hypothetical protein
MTDPARRARDLNEAARHFAETLADSYRLVYAQASESGERQRERARQFSELVATNLREQTEASRAGAELLSEQAQRQREASQELARESVAAYAEFLDDAFSRYRSSTERADRGGGRRHGARGADDGLRSRASSRGGRVSHRGLRPDERR